MAGTGPGGTSAVGPPSKVLMSMSIRLALQTLRANPLRTALSTLGIVMGAASLSAVLALGDGAEAFARRRLEAEGLQTVQIAARTADQIDGVRVPRAQVVRLGPGDAAALAAAVGPRVGLTLSRRGVIRWREASGTDWAATAHALVVLGPDAAPPLAGGRALGAGDAGPEARVAVVSSSVARTLAPAAADAVGRDLVLGAQRLRVVGVLAPAEGRDPPRVQVPDAVFDTLPLFGVSEPPMIVLRAASVEGAEALRATVDAWASRRHGDGLTVSAFGAARLRQAAQGILIFKLLMGSFTAIALLVGGIGIMNVLLASVLERTREIGVRRAVGARRGDVVRQLLAESVAIALTGSLVGLALGLGGAFVFTALMRARTEALIYAAVTPGRSRPRWLPRSSPASSSASTRPSGPPGWSRSTRSGPSSARPGSEPESEPRPEEPPRRLVAREVLRGCAVGVQHSRQEAVAGRHRHRRVDHEVRRWRVDLAVRRIVRHAAGEVAGEVDVDVELLAGAGLRHRVVVVVAGDDHVAAAAGGAGRS